MQSPRLAVLLVVVALGCDRGGAGATSDKSPAPRSDGPPAKRDVVAAGTGWWCFRIGPGSPPLSMCARTEPDCDHNKTFITDPTVKLSDCKRQNEAACFTMRHANGFVISSCHDSPAACRYRADEWRTRPDGATEISTCETFS